MTGPWLLDPSVTFLNHGSFGSCPRPVLEVQSELRARLEREPVHFFVRELEPLLDETRASVAELVGASASDVALVPNATYAVNSVLASVALSPGDEVVVTSHGYNACNNAARRWAERAGARVVEAAIPFPIERERDASDAVLRAIGERTRLLVVDHVTSPTGLVLPVETIVRAAEDRGVMVLVDGAHAPGMLSLALDRLGASFYTGNLHKWTCAPKGAAFLHARSDRQAGLHPIATSHGANATRTDRSRFLLEFDWTGTDDPTALLSVPAAIAFVRSLAPGGLDEVARQNRALALEGRAILCNALGIAPPCPDSMIGSLAAVPLPTRRASTVPSLGYPDPLQDALVARHRIQVPIVPFPRPPDRLVRISAHRHNHAEQYRSLAHALVEELAREREAAADVT
jgi:isopenicillin-N epimerase